MLASLLGSSGSEKVLLFIAARGEGYAREIARLTHMGLYPVQRQLERLEAGGILVCKPQGRTLVYSLNPAYPFLPELRQMLEKALVLSAAPSPEPADKARQAAPEPLPPKPVGRMTQEELAAYVQERLRQKRD